MVDILSGDIIKTQEEAHTSAIWTLGIRPDSKVIKLLNNGVCVCCVIAYV